MNRKPQSSEVADTIPLRSTVCESADSPHRLRLRAFDQTAIGLFPEWVFPVHDEFRQAYRQSVVAGYETMQRQRVVIAGLARNVEHVLQRTMARIERLGSMFADYRVVIYENDSEDDSRKMLQHWSEADDRVHVLTEDRHDPVNRAERCLSRASRMAYYRTQCQNYVLDHFDDFDHVILMDTDLEGGWSYDGIAHTFGQPDWDFVGSFGIIFRRKGLVPNRVVHYDAWAYREDLDFTPLTTAKVNRIVFHRGEPMKRLTSCFGGLGIYRMPAFQAGTYGSNDIEHVEFHRTMRQKGFGNVFLNPSQITMYGRKDRTMDPWAAKILRVMDAVPGVRPTPWHFPKEEFGEGAVPFALRRAA
ncbi:MAG: glycosyltransferase family 2 protein [Planctomycetales bacterium]|nr:glycosyltransferase family 2 protein [Planctomycetales bacterium]